MLCYAMLLPGYYRVLYRDVMVLLPVPYRTIIIVIPGRAGYYYTTRTVLCYYCRSRARPGISTCTFATCYRERSEL